MALTPPPRARRALCRRALLALCVAAIASAAAATPASAGEPLVPYIIGGQQASISQFPWQVFIEGTVESGFVGCGGSILDASHILTAAHCVDHENTTTTYPAADFEVLAGRTNLTAIGPTDQLRRVSSIRTDPYFAVAPAIKDDVAILTLAVPLELSAANNAVAIPLVASGATPPPGTPLTISGYGKQSGAEGAEPDGQLYATTLSAISSDACRSLAGLNTAVLLCADGASSSTCRGDSGGPLVEGSPAVEVGVVDFGLEECPVATPDVFTNLAAPEIRAFIEGSEAPPVAARSIAAPVLRSVGAVAVDYSPLTCEPGSWSGVPTYTYDFEVDNASRLLLQSGPGDTYIPPSSTLGAPIVCIVQAANPGGVSTMRSGTTPPLVPDTTPPSASIAAPPKCRLQSCALTIRASDPNGVALTLHASASYAITALCRRRARRPAPCRKTRTATMALATLSAGSYRASIAKLPYGERIKFSVHASNAAALSQATPAVLVTTLHKPKPTRHG